MHAVRRDPELKRLYRRKLIHKGLGKTRVAVARKLGIRLWIMLRDQIDYNEFCRRGPRRQKNQAFEGWRHPMKVSCGYNHGHLCLSLQAPNLAHMKLPDHLVLAAWAKSTALATRGWSAPSP